MKKNNATKQAAGASDIPPAGTDSVGFADIGKVGRGLNMVFKGYSLVFEALANQAEMLGLAVADSAAVRNGNAQQEMAELATKADRTSCSSPLPDDLPPVPTDDDAPPFDTDAAPTGGAVPTGKKSMSDVDPTPKKSAKVAEDTPAETMSKQEFLYKLRDLSRLGDEKKDGIRNLLSEFGVKGLSAVPAEKYAEFWQRAQVL